MAGLWLELGQKYIKRTNCGWPLFRARAKIGKGTFGVGLKLKLGQKYRKTTFVIGVWLWPLVRDRGKIEKTPCVVGL